MASTTVQNASWIRDLSLQTRSSVLQSLLDALRNKYDPACALLCANLISEDDTQNGAQQQLIDLISTRARDGHADDVLDIVASNAQLHNLVLDQLAVDLSRLSEFQTTSQGDGDSKGETVMVVRLLHAVRRLLSIRNDQSVYSRLLPISFNLLRSEKKNVAFAAKDTIFAAIVASKSPESFAQEIRESVSHLLSDQALPFQQTLGYSLWLRQLLSTPSSIVSDLRESSYWDRIGRGLQYGDSERRKLCLEILKLSVQAVVDSGQAKLITSGASAPPPSIIAQYARYCTVFETLTLARSQNLLLETERDLNMLASVDSLVDSRWLYVLLHTALALDMQDPSRKVIGKWILDGNLKSKFTATEFPDFLRQSLLPWTTEGHLFVSSIRQSPEQDWRCDHGEQLSSFLNILLGGDQQDGNTDLLLDTILDFLLRARSNLYSYAAVYVMDGLVRTSSGIRLTTKQADAVLGLSTWHNLPDTAREYVYMSCWHLVQQISKPDILSETSKGRYDILQAKYSEVDHSDQIAGQLSHPSERERQVQASIQKCDGIINGTTLSADSLAEKLDDIWSDAEYLVYPRELLNKIPQTFLCSHVLSVAAHDEAAAQTIKAIVDPTLQRVLDLADTRSYLLAPFVSALRNAVLSGAKVPQIVSLDSIILQIGSAPPEPKAELQLEYATFRLMQERFGPEFMLKGTSPSSESRGIAMYLDMISRLQQHQELLSSIANGIISRWKRQKIPPPTISAFKTTLQLQVLVLCFEQMNGISASETQTTLDDLLFLMSIEPLPRYRYLFSCIIIRLMMRNESQHARILELLSTKDHHSNPKYLAALMKLAVELASSNSVTEDFATQLASTFIALSASSKVVIRHEAQWSFPLLMDLARDRQWTKICDNPAYLSLDSYIRSLPRFDDPPAERVNARYDPLKHNTLLWLAEGLWTELDYAGSPLSQQKDYLWLHEQDQLSGRSIPASCLEFGEPVDRPQHMTTRSKPSKLQDAIAAKLMTHEDAIALQTKGSAYLRNILLDQQPQQGRTNQLIVVASLVTNPYNLGGLSRVGEIFGAQALYVRDPRVIAEKDFISVAVSSHNHIDIMPLEEKDIAEFLAAKKSEGWTAVGVEQTDRSDVLGKPTTALPEKTILIIGNEREGMPGSVLSECDVLVEIPQQGVTRSMNVQTVAAVVLYEFNRQHR